MAAEAEQAAVVAVVDDLEGGPVPASGLEGEAIVAERRQEAPRTRERAGAGENGGFDGGSLQPQMSIAGGCTRIVTSRDARGRRRLGSTERFPSLRVVDYSVELESVSGRNQAEEVLTVTYADGRSDRMRLHEYERVYAIPGLYEEVVQDRLECASPERIADAVISQAAAAGQSPSELRVFDLGAGNGVVAEELARHGVSTMVGLDNATEARVAAERDRPELYAEYLVGDLADHPRVPAVIGERGLNCLVAVGALGLGHITATSFDAAWRRFPAGAWLGVTVPEDLVDPGSSDFGDYLEAETTAGRLEVLERERYRHRLLMDGSEVFYVAIVGRRTV